MQKPLILFVHAPSDDCHLLFRGAPMSLLYAISALAELIKHGQHVPFDTTCLSVWDAALNWTGDGLLLERELQRLTGDRDLKVAGISCTSYSYRWAIEIARLIKAAAPGCAVVIGGPHEDECGPVGDGASISAYGRIIDFSIQGDGEHLLVDLFGRLARSDFDASKVKAEMAVDERVLEARGGVGGIAFQFDEGRIVWRKTRPRFNVGLSRSTSALHDLDGLPFPPRHLLRQEHRYLFDVFTRGDGSLKATAQVMTHRGCTFACNFCTERGAYNARNTERVVEELLTLRKEGYEAVFFDDSTLHNYQALPDLLREMEYRRCDLNMEFGGLTRVDSVLHHKERCPLNLFVDAGFSYLYFGIEHLDDDVLKEIRKGYSVEEVSACFRLLSDCPAVRVGVSTLFGLENETAASIRRTMRFVADNSQIVLCNMSIVAYHPASVMLRNAGMNLRFDAPPPNQGWIWDVFEEGRWFHPQFVNCDYARRIIDIVVDEDARADGRLLPKLKRGKAIRAAIEAGLIDGSAHALVGRSVRAPGLPALRSSTQIDVDSAVEWL